MKTERAISPDMMGGILLALASALALVIANSPLQDVYNHTLALHVGFGLKDFAGGVFGVDKSVLHWINDGLMAIFFLMVGLEIKREILIGELSSRAKMILPLAAAIGGMVMLAVIYLWVNHAHPEALSGWAIPCATDIAFALGVMSLLGNRVPLALKVSLTAIAIIDDLGAILIIAAFYAGDLHIYALFLALLPIAGLFLLNRCGVVRRIPYILLGLLLWAIVLKSGVHATMAGVITALFIPVRGPEKTAQRLEHDLHPWVIFLILPLFGFANAGVSFEGMGIGALFQPVTLGIILGLFVGKQLGVFGAMWLSVKTGLCPKPQESQWLQLYGVAVLCGIGFTMSLFIGGLAFTGENMQASVRLGVLAGSLFSALAGYFLLRAAKT